MWVILVMLALSMGLIIGAVVGGLAYLRLVTRATIARRVWVLVLPRIAFPLFAGIMFTRLVFGSARLAADMGGWYATLSIVSVALCSIALAHVAIRADVHRAVLSVGEFPAIGVLAFGAGLGGCIFLLSLT